MATLYRTTGFQHEVRPLNGRAFSLEELQTLIGGYIQIVSANEPGKYIVCDEEGKLKSKPVNVVASTLWVGRTHGDPLVGEVLLVTADEIGMNEEAKELNFDGEDL